MNPAFYFPGVDLAVCLVLVAYALLWARGYKRGGWNRSKLCFFFDSESTSNNETNNYSATADQRNNLGGVNITAGNLALGAGVKLSNVYAPLNASVGDEFLKQYYATERTKAASIGVEGVKGGILANLGIDATMAVWVLGAVAFFFGWRLLK